MPAVVVLHPYPTDGNTAQMLAGSINGHLRVYDVLRGSLILDLTKDDARIAGAATVALPERGWFVVTTHDGHNATGLRVWEPGIARQSRSVVRRPRGGSAFIGPPVAGATGAGRPFVVYVVEDGVELLWLDQGTGQASPVHLPLPITANDLDVAGDSVYVTGGSGYLALRVT
jgi:hypothetical protein